MSRPGNPFNTLLTETKDGAHLIQSRYLIHRITRNDAQKAKLLSPNFTAFTLDTILQRLEDPSLEPGFVDPRNCLVLWARPPTPVKHLIAEVQKRLLAAAPKLWLMPNPNLHMTALEITHSKAAAEIAAALETLRPSVERIINYTVAHRTRLVKPALGFDDQAIALSFVPAAGEGRRSVYDDGYSYHHLRRDIWELVQDSGVDVGSRYVVPSAHLTIGRFITNEDFTKDGEGKIDPEKVSSLIEVIEEINEWLKQDYWPKGDEGVIKEGGEWIVGREFGLECRTGTLWYGGGDRIALGQGF